MQDSNKLLEKTRQQIASSKNTPTAAGEKDSKQPDKEAVMDALDRMFAEFELVYHNQYNKAFATPEKLIYAKKLWFSNLCHMSPERITAASHRAIRESEFLPTIKGILKFCDPAPEELGLPDNHSAYMEACNAPNPKASHRWSHPAVYHAGRASDWFFLAGTAENQAFPVFKRHYERLCDQVRRGEELPEPEQKALPEHISQPLDPEEQRKRMRKLRKELNI